MKRFAAPLIALTLATAPAFAGGTVSLTIDAKNAEEAQAIRTGLTLYQLVNDINTNGHISQDGIGNLAMLAQGGSGNVGIIHQDGDGHEAGLVQTGNDNACGIFQFGQNATANVEQTGNGDACIVLQAGF